ncbi:metallophosphoesterase [Skermanella stibiiresistens SB22]|uniref:Metallophosphoesterase n=1 Tax=Skermanella stibiiresistens SB22 TaxID=1385369 RepID=W9H2Z5_9PROT|nr:metallophosphoesterase family protein [Skermanella stibiiresistens]EWY40575.1 metallophosphoesterase [Skermanella stibiiresistens SB22]
MTVFFTSDSHFNDHRVIFMYGRPFASTGPMDEAMIARWNEVVGPTDTVWHLGDFAVGLPERRVDDLLTRLNGRKHLIAGNNDAPAVLRSAGWEDVSAYAEIEVEGTRLVMCHYAFRTWNGMHRKAVNLHGHSHGKLAPMLRQFDVGADVWNLTPVTLPQILASRPTRRPSVGKPTKKDATRRPSPPPE